MELPGHVTGLLNASGARVNQYRYSPYGKMEHVYATVPNPLRYMAREWDPDAGLYYVRNRWYDPETGRFISEDPIGLAGGINVYAYAANDPVNARDPYGLDKCEIHYREDWVTVNGKLVYYVFTITKISGECGAWGVQEHRPLEKEEATRLRCIIDTRMLQAPANDLRSLLDKGFIRAGRMDSVNGWLTWDNPPFIVVQERMILLNTEQSLAMTLLHEHRHIQQRHFRHRPLRLTPEMYALMPEYFDDEAENWARNAVTDHTTADRCPR